MANDVPAPPDPRRAVLEAIAAIAPETDLTQLRADQPLRQQIDLDSMDWLNVIGRIERRLGCTLPTEALGRAQSLDELVGCVARRTAGTPARPPDAGAPPGPTTQFDINGTVVTVRPIRGADRQLKADFVQGLSREARYKRFMTTVSELPQSKLGYLTDVDQRNHIALVALADRGGQPDPVGEARYVVDANGTTCEFAIALDDDFQHTGLAGLLMRLLIDSARARGLTAMEGLVLATNTPMLKFTRQLGFAQQHEPGDYGTVRVTLPL